MKIITHNEKETMEFGAKILNLFKGYDCFCLYGELGSGKTILTKGIGQSLGIKDVKSPTYACIREHRTKKITLYHIDCYRLKNEDDAISIGIKDIFDDSLKSGSVAKVGPFKRTSWDRKKKAIVVIEWAQKVASILPAKRLDISIRSLEDDIREINIQKASKELSMQKVKELLDLYATPKNVRKHSEIVAFVAVSIGKKMKQKGCKIDLDAIKKSALLHDMLKVCDIKNFDTKKFPYTPSKEEKEKWEKIRRRFKGKDHAEAACEILKNEGFPKIGEIIRRHNYAYIIEKENAPRTWEEKIVYYADKRVAHDKIVSVKERLKEGEKRYGKLLEAKNIKKRKKMRKKIFELEQEIFHYISRKSPQPFLFKSDY